MSSRLCKMQVLRSASSTPLLGCLLSKWLGEAMHLRTLSHQSPVYTPMGRRNLRVVAASATPASLPKVDVTRIFAKHTFYKGKSALTIAPGTPVFRKNELGNTFLEKEGPLYMEFTPATGPKQYDWSRKQIIALSVVELGSLMALLSNQSCEFYHDPNMGNNNVGMVKKTLKVEAMPDKTGFFFNLNVSNKIESIEERFSVPVTTAEFAVMRSSFHFIIPYLMGWHAFVNPSMLEQSLLSSAGKLNASNVPANPDLEWSK